MLLQAAPHGALEGVAAIPGDKSMSHRALLLAALAVGESRITGLLEGADVMATAGALRALGASVTRQADGSWTVLGCGVAGLAEPADVLDLGNAGTGVRLLMGPLAGHGFTTFLSGDASLRSRPMRRVTDPLVAMGASVLHRSGGRLPLAITGRNDLVPITWRSPVASAQIKSAVLLAGLHAPGRTTVIEPAASRDHTERMLSAMGARVTSVADEDGSWRVAIEGEAELAPQDFPVPADPSSAAFPMVAALLAPGSSLTLPGISINPLRAGLLTTLREMGAGLELANERNVAGEPVADLHLGAGPLEAVDVPAARAPSMIDEYPVLAVAAAFARGTTRMRGLAELRVKESDRLDAMAKGLAAAGVEVAVEGDDLLVTGPVRSTRATRIDARHDHRIAMSFLVLGGLGTAPVTVAGAETILTSFPGFAELMNRLGADLSVVEP